jgi:hypothetical protein
LSLPDEIQNAAFFRFLLRAPPILYGVGMGCVLDERFLLLKKKKRATARNGA